MVVLLQLQVMCVLQWAEPYKNSRNGSPQHYCVSCNWLMLSGLSGLCCEWSHPWQVPLPSPMWLVQSAHLAVIDALMAVGAMETVAAVKTCGSAELLGGASRWEDALLHWVNVVRRKPRINNAFICCDMICNVVIWWYSVKCFFIKYSWNLFHHAFTEMLESIFIHKHKP